MGESIAVKNLTEDFVNQYIDVCMREQEMCVCGRCRADVFALSLNNLPPHYVVSGVGEAMVRHDAQTTQGIADIVGAITAAIKIVKDNPHHD